MGRFEAVGLETYRCEERSACTLALWFAMESRLCAGLHFAIELRDPVYEHTGFTTCR